MSATTLSSMSSSEYEVPAVMLAVTVASRTPAATPTTQFSAYLPSSSTPITAARLPTAANVSWRNGLPETAWRLAAAARLAPSSAKGAATKIASAVAATQDVLRSTSASSSVKPALAHALRCDAKVLRRKL